MSIITNTNWISIRHGVRMPQVQLGTCGYPESDASSTRICTINLIFLNFKDTCKHKFAYLFTGWKKLLR